jgi:hypothetical protein
MSTNQNSSGLNNFGSSAQPVTQSASIHHIDQLTVNADTDIGDARVTSVAQQVLNYDPEAMIWQDSPSLSVMLSNVIKWVILFIVWLAALSHFAPAPVPAAPASTPETVAEAIKPVKKNSQGKHSKSKSADVASSDIAENARTGSKVSDQELTHFGILAIGILVFFFKVLGLIKRALSLRSIRYSMTSQRLKIESGIFSKTSNTYELHVLGSGQMHTPFFMGLFGRSNLYVSGLWLVGIRNAEAVRDLIRNAGQIEASRVDKARFR